MIAIENISVEYQHRERRVVALQNLSLTVADGEFVCILGPSGCGKSTLLHVIGGFLSVSAGSVQYGGRPIKEPASERGIVFQQHNLFPWRTVEQNIRFGPRMRGVPVQDQRDIVSGYLKAMGLEAFGTSYPVELSVGMQQRVALARAFANDPNVLLMDEPFASLDSQTAMEMRDLLLKTWAKNRNTILFVTHDIEEAILLSDRVLVFSARPGRLKGEIAIDLPRPRPVDCLVLLR